ncbi:DUF397 domain-containing protein [Streptomyces sp. NPDC059785]|uniref:DUF397 domain-containing protein n=1 Tax=unclassified Streptomyces TaxID=2593676 RepID=UPI0036671914
MPRRFWTSTGCYWTRSRASPWPRRNRAPSSTRSPGNSERTESSMSTQNWQKSSYCAQGDACLHVSHGQIAIHLTESADPTHAVLLAAPAAFAAFLGSLKASGAPDTPTHHP